MSDLSFPGQFPSNIITEILTRLPAKSLARFRSVSQTWNSQIFNPHFISSYISHHSPSSWVIINRVISFNTESTHPPTQFQLVDPPLTSFLSANPHLLASEPITDPARSSYPAVVVASSNGFLLFSLQVERDPHKEHKKNPGSFSHIRSKEGLLVINPITNGWVPLPEPSCSMPIMKLTAVGFAVQVDSFGVLEKFLVVEYQPMIGGDFGYVLCFSSDIGKWEQKWVNYMLGSHFSRNDRVFELTGRFFWVDLSCGIIAWENDDPFRGVVERSKRDVCRFIPLPEGCRRPFNTLKLEEKRVVYGCGGYINYIEVFKKGDYGFKLWRLKDYGSCSGEEWSLVYNVSRVDYLACGMKKSVPRPCFTHPFEVDIVFFETGDSIFPLIFILERWRIVLASLTVSMLSHVRFRVGLLHSLRACYNRGALREYFQNTLGDDTQYTSADYAKEKGNEYFKDQKFVEAIQFYTRSITLSRNAFAYANRALAYFKVRKFHEAEADCTEALNLNGEYFKAYGRRAIARKELGNLEGSLEDMEFALKLDPQNREMKKQHAEIKSLLEKASCRGY